MRILNPIHSVAFNLGNMYYNGEGVPQDDAKAV
jgi:TPR repeat protein